MKTLWTPWRMEHVDELVPREAGCLFEPPGEAKSDKSRLLLYRDPLVLVMLNRFPYANGHLLPRPGGTRPSFPRFPSRSGPRSCPCRAFARTR